MKISNCTISLSLFLFVLALKADSNIGTAPPTQTPACAVVQRGPHNRIWQSVVAQTGSQGQTTYRTNSYNELATGLCFWNGTQWVDASDQIQLTANGAAATNTQHQVSFAANINTGGAINLATPDGQQMTSQILGLAYTDGSTSNHVFFAETQDSIGQLLPSGNQVIYTNAFTNADCDVLYSHKLAGFEQDIVIRQQLPSPSSFGLEGSNIWLQVWTEFTATPAPRITQQNSGDNFLDFGAMKMGQGKAFMLGGRSNTVPVVKQWVSSQGRTFLVESVLLDAIASKMATLPAYSGSSGSSISIPGTNSGAGSQSKIHKTQESLASLAPPLPNFKNLKLPSPKLAKKGSATMSLAGGAPNTKGLVLDYYTFNGSQTDFTFQSDSTYYVTNEVDLSGTTIIEGGTVIKYSTNGIETIVPADLVWKTGPYRPAIFTAIDDDSVGEHISGSSGTPTGTNYGFIALNLAGCDTSLVSNARFSFLNAAVAVGSGTIRNVQFNQCSTVMAGDSQGFDGGSYFAFYNVLAWNIGTFVGWEGGYGGQTIICENCTLDGCSNFFTDITDIVTLNNCIFASVGTWSAYELYNSDSVFLDDDTGVFQSVGAGNFYLAPGTYQGQGSGYVDGILFADLCHKTTYPPIILSNLPPVSTNVVFGPQAVRDNSGDLDLGYHYDPIDYIVDNYRVTNATLTLTNGAAVACYTDPVGIYLFDGSALLSVGSVTSPNWFTTYQMVQEQAITIGVGGTSQYLVPYHFGSTGPNGLFQFTKFSGGGTALYDSDPYAFNNLLVEECEFWTGGAFLCGSTNPAATTVINNSLFARCVPDIEVAASANLAFSNNLVWCAADVSFKNLSGGNCYAYNNVFDTCNLLLGHGSSLTANGYNAYLNMTTTNRLVPAGTYDIVTNISLAYQTGPLGYFYQPTNSLLIDKGSANANLLGLYQYTTQSNQVKEADSIVDIGYHYVATDANGNPLDSNNDGMPDYLEDANGNGVVNTGEYSWTALFAINITSPTNNASLAGPLNLTVTAVPTNCPFYTITQVQFFAGPKSLGTSTSSPYSVVWTNALPGSFTLSANAMNSGSYTASGSINITINTNLSAVADAYVNDGTLANSNFGTNTVLLGQTASGTNNNRDAYFKFNLGTVTNITNATLWLYADLSTNTSTSATVYSVTNTSWLETNITWNNKPALITALATNTLTGTNGIWYGFNVTGYLQSASAAGQTAISLGLQVPTNETATININSRENSSNQPMLVLITTNSPPSVSITSPTNGAFLVGPIVPLATTATDVYGVNRVDYFAGYVGVAYSSNSPFSANWSNMMAGNYTLTARATDPLALTTTSSPINVRIVYPPAPNIYIPTNNESYSAGSTVLIHAGVTSGTAPVTNVQFFRGGTLIAQITNYPYQYYWSNVAAGDYTLTAVAEDTNGFAITSAPINITVSGACSYTYSSNNAFGIGMGTNGYLINLNYTNSQGALEINAQTTPSHYLNLPCKTSNTMLRLDIDTTNFIGEYLTAPQGKPGYPGHTVVDRYGNTWVANWAEAGNTDGTSNGSITEIGIVIGGTRGYKTNDLGGTNFTFVTNSSGQYLKPPFEYCTAIDRDGDGLIRTSSGQGNILSWPTNSFVPGWGSVNDAEDECIIKYIRTPSQLVSALALDSNNDLWISGYCNHSTPDLPGNDNCYPKLHVKINGLTGQVLTNTEHLFSIGSTSYGGFDALVGPNGMLWSAGGANSNASISLVNYNPASGVTNITASSDPYFSMAIDPQTGNLWVTSFNENHVCEFSPSGTNLIATYYHGDTYGGGLAIDNNGNVWVAHGPWSPASQTVGHLRTDGTYLGNVDISGYSGGNRASTVAIDSNGKIWAICANMSGQANLVQIDPNAGRYCND